MRTAVVALIQLVPKTTEEQEQSAAAAARLLRRQLWAANPGRQTCEASGCRHIFPPWRGSLTHVGPPQGHEGRGGRDLASVSWAGKLFFINAQTGEEILCLVRGRTKDNPECICFDADKYSNSSEEDKEDTFPKYVL